jgi:hypothetical protein
MPTIRVDITWHVGWPVATPTPMFESAVGDAVITGQAQTDGSIVIEVRSQEALLTVKSSRLNPKSNFFQIFVAWEFPSDLSAVANGKLIASLMPLESPLPEVVELPKPKPRTPKDFSSENAQALQARKDFVAQLTAKSGNRLTEIMHHAALFLHVRRAGARRRSVRRDRCEATRDATRSGLMCRVGGSSGHMPPRPMGRTA